MTRNATPHDYPLVKITRFLQVFLASVGLIGLVAMLPLVIKRWDAAGPSVLILPIITLVVLGIPVGITALPLRTMRAKGARVRAAIEAIAAGAFDRPAAVKPGYDLSVTMPASSASFVAAMDNGAAFTTAGEYRGVSASIASHVSRVGRQFGEMSHVYSHVVVDVRGATPRFSLMRQGAGALVARMAGLVTDVKIGDDAFDAMWNIDADEGLARAVLDPSIRARLTEMKSRVRLVSQEWGAGGMTLLLTRHGLALRWPGDFNLELALYIRDLLLDMRALLLAHLDRDARAPAAATG